MHVPRKEALLHVRFSLGVACIVATTFPAMRAQANTPPPQTPVELGDVTVTAQAREQLAKDVPVAMDVLDEKSLDVSAATDLSQLNLLVPGLQVKAAEPVMPVYRLRGLETGDYGIGTESAVSIYIDGVYQTRSGGALLALTDVDRVEVLKGPQGALLGRNTPAGAISIITREPAAALQARVRIRSGNDGRRYGDAMLNVPLRRDMSLRINVLDSQGGAWIRNATSGQHYGGTGEWGARAAWRWDMTPFTRVRLTWSHDRLRQVSSPNIGLSPVTDVAGQRPPFPADPATYRDPRRTPLRNDASDPHDARRYQSGTLTIEHDVDWGTLTSTTSGTSYTLSQLSDADGTDHPVSRLDTGLNGRGRNASQEVRVAGATTGVDWIAGASYYVENARQSSLVRSVTDTIDTLAIDRGIPTGTPDGTLYGYLDSMLRAARLPWSLLGQPLQESVLNHGRSQARAVYGDAIWHLTDRLNLTTGVRYTRDDKSFAWYTPERLSPDLDRTLDGLERAGILARMAGMAGLTPAALRAALDSNLVYADAVGQHVRRRDTWRDVSPRVVLDYRFTADTMAYAILTRGYKAGGYNSVQVGSVFAPERVWNVEAGVKALFPAHRVMLDVSLYHYRYDARQALTLVPTRTPSGISQYRVSNADQQATGLDLKLQWVPFANLRLDFSGAYINSTYRHAIASSGIDLSGQPVDEPKIAYAVGAAYTWRGVANGDLSLDARYGFRGPQRCNASSYGLGTCFAATTFAYGAAQRRTDIHLGWAPAGSRFSAGAYVTNVFNQRYVVNVNNVTTSALGTPYGYLNLPRRWGMELQWAL